MGFAQVYDNAELCSYNKWYWAVTFTDLFGNDKKIIAEDFTEKNTEEIDETEEIEDDEDEE